MQEEEKPKFGDWVKDTYTTGLHLQSMRYRVGEG